MVNDILYFLTIAACLVAGFMIWQWQELKRFNLTRYEIHHKKLSDSHRFVVLSDVHLWQYGAHNERLIAAVRSEQPDVILFPGDLIVHSKPEHFAVAAELMERLAAVAPVYFSNGNHESRLEQPTHENYAPYQKLKQQMQACGVHILNNAHTTVTLGGDTITVSGLELPLSYFRKGVDTPLAADALTDFLGEADKKNYQILLAHTPRYVPEYFIWGADLCLSGHYHGGLVCIPGIGSVISPQFELFPKYSFGRFDTNGHTALVSRGLGTHTFHVRVFNRSEILVVTAAP